MRNCERLCFGMVLVVALMSGPLSCVAVPPPWNSDDVGELSFDVGGGGDVGDVSDGGEQRDTGERDASEGDASDGLDASDGGACVLAGDGEPCVLAGEGSQDGGEGDDGPVYGQCKAGVCVAVECDCSGESACCDGCGAVHVGDVCFEDELVCTSYLCSQSGNCEMAVGEGWCLVEGICLSTDTDPANCGSCGNACDEGKVCSAGRCTISCSAEFVLCPGIGGVDTCVDLDSDRSNCGACGNACPPGSNCVSAHCGVRVTGVTISPTALTLEMGETGQLTAVIMPQDAGNQGVLWLSSRASVATVDSAGVVTGVGSGQTTITAVTIDGEFTATCLVTVSASVDGVQVEPASLSLMPGEERQLVAVVTPQNAPNREVTWASSNQMVVTVNGNGRVTAVDVGNAVVTATTVEGGFQAACQVVVDSVGATGVQLSPHVLNLNRGQQMYLQATVLPLEAGDKRVNWSSSAPQVASVTSAGLVRGETGGQATITVSTVSGGYTDICRITVKNPVTGITVTPQTLALAPGATAMLIAKVEPVDATDKTVTWSSSDEAIARAGVDGMVTGVAVGQAVITASTRDGGFAVEVPVRVAIAVTGVTVSPASMVLRPGETGALTAQVAPSNATDKRITWTSSAPDVATVDEAGVVSAVAGGSAIITVRTVDGDHIDTATIYVSVPVAGVSLDQTELFIAPGASAVLTALFEPANATDKRLLWSSSAIHVATVSSAGVVQGVASGSTTITVTAIDGGFTATCQIYVGATGSGTAGDPWRTDPVQANCDAYLDGSFSRGDGVYSIDPDGAGSGGAPFNVWCDMTTEGGGWTMLLKADGRKSTFTYDSGHWTSTTPLNPDKPEMDGVEAKLASYSTVPFTKVLLRFEYPIGSGTWRNLSFNHTGQSMYAIMSGNTYIALNPALGREAWKNVLGNTSSLQPNCNREGFNNHHSYAMARIGIISNQENDCESPDSRIGIGTKGDACSQNTGISVGNSGRCSADRGDADLVAFGVLFAK